jgi:hypothetical protein
MATINSGQGFAQLYTMAAFFNMPCMSNMTYQKLHLDISNHTNDTWYGYRSNDTSGK